jgi:hypothetical protein
MLEGDQNLIAYFRERRENYRKDAVGAPSRRGQS